jgi:hypothetical protein
VSDAARGVLFFARSFFGKVCVGKPTRKLTRVAPLNKKLIEDRNEIAQRNEAAGVSVKFTPQVLSR